VIVRPISLERLAEILPDDRGERLAVMPRHVVRSGTASRR
jgi:hypothetical protein